MQRVNLIVGTNNNHAAISMSIKKAARGLIHQGVEITEGLSQAQRALCSTTVRIPMVGDVDSLNLAVAGSGVFLRKPVLDSLALY